MAAMLIVPTVVPKTSGSEKRKIKKSVKVGPKKKARVATPEPVETTTRDVPPLDQLQASEPAPSLTMEVTRADESSPGTRATSSSKQGREDPPVDMRVDTDRVVAALATASPSGPTPKPGAESTFSDETGTEATSSAAEVESDPRVTFHHKLTAVGKQRWRELRGKLIGDLEEGYSPKEDPSEGDRFVLGRHLHKNDSVMLSGRSQISAIHQFALEKDMDLLKEVPSAGLRLTLQSYHTRAALVGEELYDRLDFLNQICGELRVELTQERWA